jgi:hypothetical protein
MACIDIIFKTFLFVAVIKLFEIKTTINSINL